MNNVNNNNNNECNTTKTVEEYEGSELGTKEYWETYYGTELVNYTNAGVVGDIWFDEESQDRVITWLLARDNLFSINDSVIDVGCGNGMMLIEMYRHGFTNLTGVDYVKESIDLSKSIAKDQQMDIRYEVIDLLNDEDLKKIEQYRIVHDKGTYDAISLHPDDTKLKRQQYIDALHRITIDGGYLILTSCNWTESELIECFNEKFHKEFTIPTPTFQFGGKIGNIVTTIVLKKILR